MGSQQKRSGALAEDSRTPDDSPLETSNTQSRGILQERSSNWPQGFTIQAASNIKTSRSSSPIENPCLRRATPARGFFAGNVHTQHIGLAGVGTERPEKQVEYELKRLYRMLQRSDKYQKYREKQPSLTVAEVLARDAADRKRQKETAEGKSGKEEKDKTVWPEFLEHAFWRALVRWPPMGRKKCMLDGALRGRNELIQDSIRKDTGVERCRKQVSSHLQVLKQHLQDQPGVLLYMGTKDNDKKRLRGTESSYSCLSSARGRHHSHRAGSVSKYDYNPQTAHLWAGQEQLPLPYTPAMGLGGDSKSPFTVTDFNMFVEDNNRPVHYFTQLSSNGRLGDLHVTEFSSWRRQYPEFDFLRPQAEIWMKQNRRVLVCDASIKVMTEARPKADLSITFELHAFRDLSVFDSTQCITRFYDSGNMAPDPQFDGHDAHDLKEHQTLCHYMSDPLGPSGCLRIAFGSKFWVNRMLKYQSLRNRDEGCVSRSLLRLTATQDVYGIRSTGEAECVLTILWRFTQTTRSSAEVGSMNWRAVTFGSKTSPAKPRYDAGDNIDARLGSLLEEQGGALESSNSIADNMDLFHPSAEGALNAISSQDLYARPVVHADHPPQLNLDILASLQSDLDASHPTTAASASTDFSQHSLSTLTNNQDIAASYAQDPNNFNFDDGPISISGAFGPSINLSAYDGFADDVGLDGLQALSGLDQDGYSLGLACGNHDDLIDVGLRHDLQHDNLPCYSTKPNWHHGNLVSSLENAAEQYHGFDQGQTTHGHERSHIQQTFGGPSPALTQDEELLGLHSAQVATNPAMWNLQSPFQEDTGSGAHDTRDSRMKNVLDYRKDSVGQGMGGGHGLGLGIGVLDMIQREQQAWDN